MKYKLLIDSNMMQWSKLVECDYGQVWMRNVRANMIRLRKEMLYLAALQKLSESFELSFAAHPCKV